MCNIMYVFSFFYIFYCLTPPPRIYQFRCFFDWSIFQFLLFIIRFVWFEMSVFFSMDFLLMNKNIYSPSFHPPDLKKRDFFFGGGILN